MNRNAATVRRGAFSLVEMMVVVAIIALLLAALLPAFSAVRNQARIAQANAQFKALDTGINAFRAEATALGGSLPPSSSDDPTQRQTIANPKDPPDSPPIVRVTGAHLLVHAMIGADGLGTPGFRDLNNNGRWSDDSHRKFDDDPKKCGIYAIYDTGDKAGKERFPRYGGAGYVDEKMKESAKTLKELVGKAAILTDVEAISPTIAFDQRVFTDPWDHPILYYRASPTAIRMTGSAGKPGVFWQEDNGVITGTKDGAVSDEDGIDFGQGKEGGYLHHIAVAKSPEPTETVDDIRNLMDEYKYSFARFIIDGSVKARPTPVQKDSYLLISAGLDSRYGTDDDVTNWTRKTD